MHNLHYIVIRADSGKEACDAVENEIVEWGSEDNWGQICGALSEKNIIYNTGDGRWEVEKNNTIKGLSKKVKSWFIIDSNLNKIFYDQICKVKVGVVNNIDWWAIKEVAEHNLSVSYVTHIEKFDILLDNFRSYEFDTNGVTNFYGDEDKQQWVVYIDMHS